MKYLGILVLMICITSCLTNEKSKPMLKEIYIENSEVNLEEIHNGIEKITFKNNFRGIIPFSKLKNIESLKYLRSEGGGVREFNGEGLKFIDTLLLSNNKMDIIINFESLSNLIYLDLSRNQIKSIEKSGVFTLKNLKHIDLSYNYLKSVSFSEECNSIKWLSLRSNRLQKIDSSISFLTNIEYLDISDNLFESIPPEIYNLPNLKTLKISDNLISKEEILILRKSENISVE